MSKIELPEITKEVAKACTEIMVEYRRGIQNLAGAMQRMSKVSGLPPEICKIMLSGLSQKQRNRYKGVQPYPPETCRWKDERLKPRDLRNRRS
jgi:hypothetical protein